MTTEKKAHPAKSTKKAPTKAKPAAKPAAKAAPVQAKAPAAPKPAPAASKPKPASGKAVKVTQIGSPAGRPDWALATLKGLGLNKLHRTRVLEDTPSVRGMIKRVKHLLRVEDAR